jgi:hypothetical protein
MSGAADIETVKLRLWECAFDNAGFLKRLYEEVFSV